MHIHIMNLTWPGRLIPPPQDAWNPKTQRLPPAPPTTAPAVPPALDASSRRRRSAGGREAGAMKPDHLHHTLQ